MPTLPQPEPRIFRHLSTVGLGRVAADLDDWRARVRLRARRADRHTGDSEVLAVVDYLQHQLAEEARLRDRLTFQAGDRP